MVLEALDEQGHVTVSDLGRRASVSEMTIRRDLEALERTGALVRVHGGAQTPADFHEPSFALREGRARSAKTRIGKKAMDLLSEGNTVAIDSGSTTIELARALAAGDLHVTVVTASIRVAREVMEQPHLRTIVAGGLVRRNELSLVGDITERTFRDLRPDFCFVGAGGVDAEAGVTDHSVDDIGVKRALCLSAVRCIVLADQAKLGEVAFARVCPLSSVDMLITDGDAEQTGPIGAAGVGVLTI